MYILTMRGRGRGVMYVLTMRTFYVVALCPLEGRFILLIINLKKTYLMALKEIIFSFCNILF